MVLLHPATQSSIDIVIADPPQTIALNGEGGLGKKYVAEYIAWSLLGVDLDKLASHPYVLTLHAKDKAGIDDVREVQKGLTNKVPGSDSVNRIVIITDVDLLGHEAQNALLKTLEEPPKKTVIIITYGSTESVLSTIRSRAQNIEIKPVSKQYALQTLSDVYNQSDIERAYAMSSGKPSDLIAILEGTHTTLNEVIAQAKSILSMDRYHRLCEVDRLSKLETKDLIDLLQAMVTVLRAAQKQLTNKTREQQLANIRRLEEIDRAMNDIRNSTNKKLVLSDIFSTI